jgi:hypothetical protein
VVEGLDDTGRVVVLAPGHSKEKAGGAEPRTGLKPPEGAARGVLAINRFDQNEETACLLTP